MPVAVTPSAAGPAAGAALVLNALLGRRVPHPDTAPVPARTAAAATGARAVRQHLITPDTFPAYRSVTRAGREWTVNGVRETMSGTRRGNAGRAPGAEAEAAAYRSPDDRKATRDGAVSSSGVRRDRPGCRADRGEPGGARPRRR